MKKRIALFFLPLTLLLLLVACGKNPKDEFLSRMKSQQTAKKAAFEYSIQLDDISFSQEEGMGSMLESYVGKEVRMDITQDLDASLMSIHADLSDLNPGLSTVDLIYADDRAYMSIAPFAFFYGLDAVDMEGKYLDLEEMGGQDLPKLSDIPSTNQQYLEMLEDLEASRFTKDGQDVILTLSMEEVFELTQEMFAQTDKKAAQELKAQMGYVRAYISDESYMRLTFDKEGNGTAVVDIRSAENEKDGLTISMMTKKKAYKVPKVPKAADVLSQEDLQAMLVVDEDMLLDSKLSDEEFAELYDNLKEETAAYTQAETKELIDQLSPSLTKEQVKKLEGLLD